MLEVRRLRSERGWRQSDLAYRAGLAPSVVSEIETGKREPRAGTLRKLASALEVEVPDLYPKAQGALFSPDNPPVRRGADETVYELVRVLNEALYKMQEAYAPDRELDWSREALEEVSTLIAKAAVAVAPVALGAGFDSHVEAVQVLARADEVVRLLDARAAEAPAQTGPLPDNVVELRGDVEDLRAAALERAG